MMRYFLWLLVLSALLAGPGEAQGPTLEDLGQDYRRWREVKGHFQGGSWCDDVDRWGGRKHKVMGRLGELLGSGATERRVVEVMGEPDERARAGSLSWQFVKPDRGEQLLIYTWRGHHDFLYFTCDAEGKVLKSGWWMALE